MKHQCGMGRETLRQLNSTLSGLSKRAGYDITVEDLLHQWEKFVEDVEAGYDDSIYEYANDLGTRSLLNEIVAAKPDHLTASLKNWLLPLDQRFFDATTEALRAVPGTAPTSESLWCTRIPKMMSDELRRDLFGAGLIK
ncbi:MAG: hypothetical protein ABI718_15965 [Acidobacteriota bacterium]